MKQGVLGRIILIAATVILATVFFLPNTPFFDAMPKVWKDNMPDKGITLGLDLQGGLHLVFEVEGEKAVELTTERMGQVIKDSAKKKNMPVEVKVDTLTLTVSPMSPELEKMIKDDFSVLEAKGGGKYMLTAAERTRVRDNSTEQAIETIRNRIDQFGVAEPSIQRQGTNELVIQLPGVKDPKRAIDIIGKTALLEFKIVDDKNPIAAELPQAVKVGEEDALLAKFKEKLGDENVILFERSVKKDTGEVFKIPILLKKQTLLTGDLLSEARVSIDQRYNEPYVSLTFNASGAKIFEDVTAANVKNRMAIILDGNVYSAPVIRERIAGGNAQISGSYNMDEAKDLAIVLKAGALPAPVKMLQNVTVGPSLGRDSIQAGKMAGLIGSVMVMLFMIVYYRVSGVIANFALVLNIILLLGAMASLNATLTMPGIAGIILAVGMAVDSNVLMFERMREEIRAGKTPRAAVDSGYDKAFWTIFDSHVTTLITAAVLFQFGTGPIKGFAVTLSLGVIINLYTALIGTKTVFDLMFQRGEVKELSI